MRRILHRFKNKKNLEIIVAKSRSNGSMREKSISDMAIMCC